ncbi:MAG: FAD-dependent oxidoreductase [Gemmatimonadales bacterium]
MAATVGGVIVRDPEAAARESYDLVIVGGGVYGTMLLLEAAQRGARAVLLERHDFGGATSWNSLRVVHGGLRYLQSGDLIRFTQSVRERSWFLSMFPDQVRPLPCLMPLYSEGARRPVLLAAALAVNDLLSRRRNRGLTESSRLPGGCLVDEAETARRFPLVDRQGLRAGALWYDALMQSPQRVLIETLHWAGSAGGTALNYVEARRVELSHDRVAGVEAIDHLTGTSLRFRAPAVVNCAGPWCRVVASAFDRDAPELFRPSLAFNLLLRREPISDGAVAVAPRRPGGRVYFLVPYRDRVCAGTFHAPWPAGVGHPVGPTNAQVDAMLEDLNAAVPGWELNRDDVLRVFSGLLPARTEGSAELTVRPGIRVHGSRGGPQGLVSISGVKFTTARLVAEQICALLDRHRYVRFGAHRGLPRPAARPLLEPAELTRLSQNSLAGAAQEVRDLMAHEAVTCAEDLMLRRTDWGTDPTREPEASRVIRWALGEAPGEKYVVAHGEDFEQSAREPGRTHP